MYSLNQIINRDCLEGMRLMESNSFELAIVDPPYGIHTRDKKPTGFMAKRGTVNRGAVPWDRRPPAEYFEELRRVSVNQIIWGAQYFISDLEDTRGMVVWDKGTGENAYADGELAYVSHGTTLRIFDHQWCGAFKASEVGEKAEFPTQKPVALYKWLLSEYAKPGDRILDTHVGSGSSILACIDLGFDYLGFEIDPEYYAAIERRIYRFTRQKTLF